MKPFRYAKNGVKEIFETIVKKLPDLPSAASKILKGLANTVDGLWLVGRKLKDSIIKGINAVVEFIVKHTREAYQSIRSKLIKEVKEATTEAAAKGVKETTEDVIEDAVEDGVQDAIEDGVSDAAIKGASKSDTFVKIEGIGSTGRTEAKDLYEEIAMKGAKTNPFDQGEGNALRRIVDKIRDDRWKNWEKWQIVSRTKEGRKITIHFNYDPVNKLYDDFKFK